MAMPTPRPADYAAARAIGVRVGLLGLPLTAVTTLADAIKTHEENVFGPVRPGPRVAEGASTATFAACLIVLCLAGFVAARRTGFMQAAVVAGFIAGLLDGIGFLVFGNVWRLLYPMPLNPVVPARFTLAHSFVDVLLAVMGAALLAGASCGFLGGAIDALLHRRQHSRAG